jgi:hypothetical protein
MPDPSEVLLDPAAAYPALAELRAALVKRDWTACRAVLDAAPTGLRTLLIRVGAQWPGVDDFLRAARNKDLDDAAAGAMLGFHRIDVGWRIRTRARAQNVSREQFASFFDWLRKAERVLIDAAARNPGEPAIWAARIMSARGLELGLAEGRRRYDRLRAADPYNYVGQSQFLQMMCPKWAGSWDRLHAWTREELLAAPPGKLSGGLVAEAHLEHWFDLQAAEQKAYMADPKVRDELVEAAERSIWHGDFRRDAGWVAAASAFAMAFGLAGDQRSAAASFTVLGDLASRFPWEYLGNDVTGTVRDRRKRAYAAAGGTR